MSGPDVLELLLPDAGRELAARARKVTTFARLLAGEGRRGREATVRVNLERARDELTRERARRAGRALEELLRHYLRKAAGVDSFAWYGETEGAPQAAWSRLEEWREEGSDLPDVPGPDESSLAVSRRLIDALANLVPAPELALWRARWVALSEGPASGETAFARGADGGEPWIVGRIECRLDAGDVRGAWTLATESLAARSEPGARLAWLATWCRLLVEGEGAAAEGAAGLEPWAGRLPGPLAELRDRRPEWVPWLPGRVDAAPRGVPAEDGPLERRAFGAVALLFLRLGPAGEVDVELCDLAPALRERLAPWRSDRDGAAGCPGEPEHRLVVEARASMEYGRDGAPPRGALGPATRALALVPARDAEGEVCGWLHVETEHALLPPLARLERAASVALGRGTGRPAGVAAPAELAADPPTDPARSVFLRLLDALGVKTVRRRWWGIEVEGEGDLRVVATGGGLPRGPSGGGRAVARALRGGGVVRFDGPEPGLARSASSQSGVVLPLRFGGRTRGLLAIESDRKRDFRADRMERAAATSRAFGLALRVAQFRRWHAAGYHRDVWFDDSERRGRMLDDLATAALASDGLAIAGPGGAGKRVLARWVHFERGAERPLRVLRSLSAPEDELFGMFDDEGTAVAEGVDRLDPDRQRLLARVLARDPAAPWVCTVGGGALVPELERRLARLCVHVPPLCERRGEILPLFECLLARFSAAQSVVAPVLEEDARAVLWRQSWEGNVRELEDWAYKLVLFHPGERVGASTLDAIARRFRIPLLKRLPSKRPSAEWIRAALEATRTGRGTWNKSRAALYLGWDPDTLVRRMRELEGAEASPADEDRDEDGDATRPA